MALIFGLYHVKHEALANLIQNAHTCGIHRFDTAELYRNEKRCAELCNGSDIITTKIYSATNIPQLQKLVKRSIRRFGSKKIDNLLLHKPMPNSCWKALTELLFFKTSSKNFDGFTPLGPLVGQIGVSNYDLDSLKDLLDYCEKTNLPKPTIHQMEVHPFVDCNPILNFCKENGIRVQAHTVLTQGKFLHHLPLVKLAESYGVSPAQVLLAWALSKDIDVCINSTNLLHLQELTTPVTLLHSDLLEMDKWHTFTAHRFYNKPIISNTTSAADKAAFVQKVVQTLQTDAISDYPSDLCETLPLAGESYRTVGKEIAAALYPTLKIESALNSYRALVKLLKQKRIATAKATLQHKKGLTCKVTRRTSGDYSNSIINPQPMPVDVTNPAEFKPFFDYVRSSENILYGEKTFIKGTMFSDGRMDLCKQVVGPDSICELCDAVSRSKIVKHFLLGNNLALKTDVEKGATAIASVMENPSVEISTWYLAGNCINSTAVKIMAAALKNNTHCKALWLKRNPVGPDGAFYLNQMLTLNKTLVLIDLHNCALGDIGVTNLLANPQNLQTLRHLYLDANGLESTTSIAAWCKAANPVTLYVSINRLKDNAIIELCESLKFNQTLKRLCLSSTHMDNSGARAVVDMALTCLKLKCLNLGCYKSTSDLGEHPGNFFNDDVLIDLKKLLNQSKTLEYLNVAGCKISAEGLASLPRLAHISMDLGKGPFHHVHDKSNLRFVKQPKRVVHIDSIYRGKM